MFRSQHFWRVYLPPHLMLALSVLTNSWTTDALFWTLGLWALISGLGIAVGFHRYFAHRSFSTRRFWEQLMLFLGNLACQGNALIWIALHRGSHHRWADTENDPHSPVFKSLWQAYQGYAWDPNVIGNVSPRAGADFLREPRWRWSVVHYKKILWGTWLATLVVCGHADYWAPMIGLVAAQVWAVHQEAVVNILGHTRGFGSYRNYETPDQSVNRPILGLLTWGQALHNNHHAEATRADFGSQRAYEWDPAMLWIRIIRS